MQINVQNDFWSNINFIAADVHVRNSLNLTYLTPKRLVKTFLVLCKPYF